MPPMCKSCGYMHIGTCVDFSNRVREDKEKYKTLRERARAERIKWISKHIGVINSIENLSDQGLADLRDGILAIQSPCHCDECRKG